MFDEDRWFEQFAAEVQEVAETSPAPARMKSQAFTAMIRAQQESGPLLDVTATKECGHALCVFEELVQVTPAGEKAKQAFYCHTCHARVLAERIEQAPIYWPNCPYVRFQNR